MRYHWGRQSAVDPHFPYGQPHFRLHPPPQQRPQPRRFPQRQPPPRCPRLRRSRRLPSRRFRSRLRRLPPRPREPPDPDELPPAGRPLTVSTSPVISVPDPPVSVSFKARDILSTLPKIIVPSFRTILTPLPQHGIFHPLPFVLSYSIRGASHACLGESSPQFIQSMNGASEYTK